MTHEELLTKVNDLEMWISLGQVHKNDMYAMMKIIRAVVELHEPNEEGFCSACFVSVVHFPYPCPTIQAIEKELGE